MSLKSIDFSSLEAGDDKSYISFCNEKRKQENSQKGTGGAEDEVSTTTNQSSLKTLNEMEKTSIDNVKSSNNTIYFYIGNIPGGYRSADLRIFFKELIEKGAFDCFHFRHRPEKREVREDKEYCNSSSNSGKSDGKDIFDTCCCLLKCKKEFSNSFFKRYHKKQWFNSDKILSKQYCIIKKMEPESNPKKEYLTNKELSHENHEEDQQIYSEDFKSLLEFNPPENVMPQGNIGTPTKYFHEMIAKCLLPCSVIKKLGLEFPKSKKTKFSSVGLDYEQHDKRRKHMKYEIGNHEESDSAEYESDKEIDKEDDDAEEWDRYEALHDDVDNQARPKERLFEEDLEVKWEKGGSGLVFYTDAYFWNEMKGKDFDEDTVDDWDVDYSVYYEDAAGDKSSRDQLGMRLEKRRREGKNDGPTKYSEIKQKEARNRRKMTESFAQFEKYSKGFGSRLLKQQGWKEGEGVGSSRHGISEPIEVEGQLPVKRTGFGYHGEKLDPSVALKRPRIAENDVYISTKYDEKDGEHIDAMRFHGMELLKYRTPKMNFTKGT